MAKALITGASGFIGRNLVDACLTAGLEVRCQVHRPQSLHSFQNSNLEAFACDICDTKKLANNLAGVTEIFHLAGVVCPYSQSLADQVNVEATRRLAEAASQLSNPPTFIYVSSLAAAGPSLGEKPRQETDSCQPVSIYGRSKWRAEQSLSPFADRMPISIVRPPGVFGPRDQNLLSLYKSIAWGWNLIGISKEFRYSLIHAADLAAGMMAVSSRGKRIQSKPSETPQAELDQTAQQGIYFLSASEALTFVELGDLISIAMNTSLPRHIAIPAPLCWTVAWASQVFGRLFNKRVFLNADKMREAVHGSWVCDASRAALEVGFLPGKPLKDRLFETYQWYRQEGWLS